MKTYKEFKQSNIKEFLELDDIAASIKSQRKIKHNIKLHKYLGKDFDNNENTKILKKLINHNKPVKSFNEGTAVLCKKFGDNYLRIGYLGKKYQEFGETLYKVNFDQKSAFWRLYTDGVNETTKELTGHGYNLSVNDPDSGILLDEQRLYSVPPGIDKDSKYFVWDYTSSQALKAYMDENPNFLEWFRWIYMDGKIKWEQIGSKVEDGYPTFKDGKAPIAEIELPWSGIVYKRGGNI